MVIFDRRLTRSLLVFALGAMSAQLAAGALERPERSIDAENITDSDTRLPANIPVASVPRLLRFSGQLQRPAVASPVPAQRLATFTLYSQEEGGSPIWSESQVITIDPSSHYTVIVGSMVLGGIPSEAFTSGQPRWLEVT